MKNVRPLRRIKINRWYDFGDGREWIGVDLASIHLQFLWEYYAVSDALSWSDKLSIGVYKIPPSIHRSRASNITLVHNYALSDWPQTLKI